MATKKDFGKINTSKAETGVNTGEVYEAIERGKSSYKQQTAASPEEQLRRASELKTQGRKGCRAERINLAFTPENYRFCRIMGGISGHGMTQFINDIITEYRQDHEEIYEKAQGIADQFEDMGKKKS